MIFFHPPYHDIIQYSGNMWGKPHPDDLSRCENYNDFLEKLNLCIRKFYMVLRKDGRLAVLVGDIRSKGEFYSIQHDMMRMGEFESFLVKGQFNCVSDGRRYEKPFIPIVTEYMLLLHKKDVFMVPFHYSQNSCFSVAETDLTALTWHHLIRMTFEAAGGRMSLVELYAKLQNHPKAKKNEHFKERIRATIYEHKDQYIACGDGTYCLTYQVA